MFFVKSFLIVFAFVEFCAGDVSSGNGLVSNCPKGIQPLAILPGRGWDNLRDREMGQITALTYFKCRTTPDGFYYIPDNTFAIPVKESSLRIFSDFIDNWSDYKSLTSSSFSASAESSFYGSSIAGSFSSDYQETKQKQVDEKSVTSRIYVKDTLYTIHTEPTVELDPGFKSQMDKVSEHIKLNNSKVAAVLLQLIVRDYGTHFQTRLDAGGILLQEDFLSRSFVQTNMDKISEIKTAASASFFGAFGGSLGYSHKSESNLTVGYLQNLRASNVRAYGGAPLKTNVVNNSNLWIDTLASNVVAVDRFGDPLHFIVTPYHFPHLEIPILARLQQLFKEAIDQYYMYNTHMGCTSMDSPNFEYNANVDDQSCHSPYNNYTFGGTFSKCEPMKQDNGNVCDGITEQKNYLTGNFSCPSGFEEMLLRSKTLVSVKGYYSWFSWSTIESTATSSSHWCYKHGNVTSNSGVMFGGTYTSKVQNPLTQGKSCPPTFQDVILINDLHICVGTDYELGFKFSIPFGGFFSCQFGNPLYDIVVKEKLGRKMSNSEVYPQACPTGCAQHTAIVDDSCMVNYCVKANSISVHGPMKVILPPFVNINTLYAEGGNSGHGLGAATIVAICISAILALALVAVIIGLVIWRKRASRLPRNAINNDGSLEPLINDENIEDAPIV